MKLTIRSFYIMVIMLVISVKANAQHNFLDEANSVFDNRQYFSAIPLYKRALESERTNAKKAVVLFKVGECYRHLGDNEQAEVWYSKAIEGGYDDPIAVYYLASAYLQMGKNVAAKQNFEKYKKLNPSDKRADIGIKSAELSEEWTTTPTRWKVENIAMLNTAEREFSPTYADENYKKVYFTSTRAGATGGDIDATIGEAYSDVFEASMDNKGMWATPIPLKSPITTENNEGLTSITKKGDLLFWTRCIPEKNKIVYNQVWAIHKSGEDWEDPKKLPFNNDTTKFASPAISPDGKILIFASNLEGGYGENDLWMSMFDAANESWSEPINLGPEINTAGNDVFPYISDDNTLYFSSDSHEGMGGLDIYKAEKIGEGKWAKLENLKYPINSNADDFGIMLQKNGRRGLISSNRSGTKGSDDIWSITLPPLLFSVTSIIVDTKWKEPVPGVIVVLTGDDGSRIETKTDSNGVYLFDLGPDGERIVKEGVAYTVSLDVPDNLTTSKASNGFFKTSAKFDFTTVNETKSKTFTGPGFDLPVKPIVAENEFPAVLYDLNMATLRPESKDSLDFLYQLLVDNPNIVIELSAHTDSRGPVAFNDKLSLQRAQSCFDYLVSKGIAAERMVPKGYGSRQPLITDAQIEAMTTEEEKEAAHQKNRRTVFKVLKKNFGVKKR